MKCLLIYATPNGESHFDEVEIPTTKKVGSPGRRAIRRVGQLSGVTRPYRSYSSRHA
jgi:hypothetical protein